MDPGSVLLLHVHTGRDGGDPQGAVKAAGDRNGNIRLPGSVGDQHILGCIALQRAILVHTLSDHFPLHQLLGQPDPAVVCKSVVQQRQGIGVLVLQHGGLQSHRNQGGIPPLHRRDQSPQSAAGPAGFAHKQARAVKGAVDELIFGHQRPGRRQVGSGHIIALGSEIGEKPLLFQGLRRNERHIPGSGVMILVRHPVGVYKVGVVGPQLLCLLVHELGEVLHRAGDRLCNGHCGIVGGDQRQCVEGILHRKRLPRFQRDMGRSPGHLTYTCLGHGDLVRLFAILQRQKPRQDLGNAGGIHGAVHILSVEDLPRFRIHQHRRLGGQRNLLGSPRHREQTGERHNGQEKTHHSTELRHCSTLFFLKYLHILADFSSLVK